MDLREVPMPRRRDSGARQHTGPEFVTPSAAARFLGLPRQWVFQEAEAGRLPMLVFGRENLVRIEDVRKLALSQMSAPAKAPEAKE